MTDAATATEATPTHIPGKDAAPAGKDTLLKLSNVTLSPHSAGPTEESFTKRFRNGYANVQRVASGQPPLWVIPEMKDLFPK